MTVSGFGLSQNATVTVGGAECEVVRGADSELLCRTPAVSLERCRTNQKILMKSEEGTSSDFIRIRRCLLSDHIDCF